MADPFFQNFETLKRLSRALAWLAVVGMAGVPLDVVGAYLLPDWLLWSRSTYPGLSACGREILEVAWPLRLAAMGLALAPAAFLVWTLHSLRGVFLRFARGEVFSLETLRLLDTVGVTLFASEVLQIAVQPPISALLTWRALSSGKHVVSLSIGLDGSDVVWLFAAGVILVIAKVMAEARRLAVENAKFI